MFYPQLTFDLLFFFFFFGNLYEYYFPPNFIPKNRRPNKQIKLSMLVPFGLETQVS